MLTGPFCATAAINAVSFLAPSAQEPSPAHRGTAYAHEVTFATGLFEAALHAGGSKGSVAGLYG